ncbi:hypothetical protein VSN93_17675 [Acinetobacter johnsonii]|uniref:hypothetical protein n=1 Tax=Acinetobacter johnsonii TaxID=40214 RepID=UPI003D17B374
MVQEALETTKFFLENPSPFVIVLFVFILVAYKGRDLLYFFFELRDLSKKRLIDKLKTEIEIADLYDGNDDLKTTLAPYFSELQLQATVGDSACTKQMANYLLTREEVGTAIRRYKSTKSLLIWDNQKKIPKFDGYFPAWRIHLNWFVGLLVYLFFSLLSAFPYFYYSLLSSEKQKALLHKVTFGSISLIVLYSIILFIAGFVILNEGIKPLWARRLCKMKSHNEQEIHIDY